MYQIAKIQNCLAGLMAFRPSENPAIKPLPADLTTAKSGLFFNDLHPLITLENIQAVAPNFSDYNYAAYDPEREYSLGEKITAAGVNYESLADANAGNDPASSPLKWKAKNYLADFLKQTIDGSVASLVSEVFQRGKLDGARKSIVEDLYLYSGGGNLNNLELKTGRFVGLEIKLKTAADLAVIISEIGTQFSQANPALNLYLYQDKKAEPLQVIPLALAGAGSFEWTETAGINLDTVTEGVYYLGYYEADLTGQAVIKEYDYELGPCSTCNQYNLDAWTKWSKHIEIKPFFVAPEDLNEDLGQWQASAVNYQQKTNYGLNLRLSVICDATQFICRYKNVLIKALGLQVTADLLAKMAFNTRVNGLAQEVKNAAFVELNNKNNDQPGVYTNLEKAIKALEFDLSGFNSICLPCAEKEYIDWSAM